jgi:hypothetical protein
MMRVTGKDVMTYAQPLKIGGPLVVTAVVDRN